MVQFQRMKICIKQSWWLREADIIVKDRFTGKVLVKDTDYTVSYYHNTAEGTANITVKVTDDNYQQEEKTVQITVKPAATEPVTEPTETPSEPVVYEMRQDDNGYAVRD